MTTNIQPVCCVSGEILAIRNTPWTISSYYGFSLSFTSRDLMCSTMSPHRPDLNENPPRSPATAANYQARWVKGGQVSAKAMQSETWHLVPPGTWHLVPSTPNCILGGFSSRGQKFQRPLAVSIVSGRRRHTIDPQLEIKEHFKRC